MRREALIALAGLASAGGAQGQTKDALFLCASHHPAEAISACTRVIKDSLQPAEDRIVAFRNRGYTYQLAGDLDGAIADYDAAVKLALAEDKHPRSRAATLLAKT